MTAGIPRPGEIVRIRSARWRIAHQVRHEAATVIEVRGCDRDNHGQRASFLLPFEPIERLPAVSRPRVTSRRRWRREARAMLAAASPSYASLDSAADADFDLLPFQLEPALAVARGLASRLLIADDVGLGKTVQAGLVVAEILRRCPGEGRALIACPAGLREQWRMELRRRFHLDAAVLDAAALAGPHAVRLGPNPWAAHPIVITSIDYVKRPEVMRALEAIVWDAAVFDEAHTLSGRSDRRTAAAALADRCRTVVLLTATPHSGDDEAFARLCGIGSIDGRFPLITFRRTRADAGLRIERRSTWLRVRRSAAEAQMDALLHAYVRRVRDERGSVSPGARLAMAVLTRRASSSAASLARSVERRLALLAVASPPERQLALPLALAGDDDEPSEELASAGLNDAAVERRLLEQLLAAARAASGRESKTRALLRLLRRAGEPAIVFTEYRDTLAHLEPALVEFVPTLLHGGLTAPERSEAIRRFTTGTAGLLLATDAASEGLNLHHRCRVVVNLELPWTPLRLEQRVGRVERIGQRQRVHAVHLVAGGTGEETTIAILCRRMARARRTLEAIAQPSPDDALRLLDSIFGDAAPAPAVSGTAADVVLHAPPPVLGDEAIAEAQRISNRRLLGAGDPVLPVRAPVTVIARRSRPAVGRWAFRTVFVDAADRRVWETVGGIEATLLRVPPGARTGLSEWFRTGWQVLSSHAAQHGPGEAAALLEAMRPAITLAIRREEAIRRALGERRARMAAALVQPGLFDRTSERAAAAQAAIANEALSRCDARLAALGLAHTVTVSCREFVFAVVVA